MADAAVSLSFIADTKQFVAELKKVDSTTREGLKNVEQAAVQSSTLAAKAVSAVGAAYEDLKRQVQGVAAVTAGALGVSTVSIGAIGTSAVKAASNFEQLRARLEGLTGSAQQADKILGEALDFAKRTPFSVEQIVQATSTLEAFGQGGVANLELVAEVASGTGQSLEDTALRFGKALSGSSEGFQGLRDTSGITAKSLEKFGARLGDVNNVALKSEKDIKAAGDALKAFAKEKFGGSIEKQSATLQGAFSNLQDEIVRFGAEIGEVLIPPLTSVAKFMADLVGKIRENIGPFKELAVVGLGVAGMFSGVGSAVALAAIPLAGMVAQSLLLRKGLQLLATGLANVPIAAAGMAKASAYFATLAETGTVAGRAITFFGSAAAKVKGLISALGAAVGGLARSAVAFIATPLGATIGAIAVTAAALSYAFSRMEKEAERVGDAIKSAAQNSVAMTNGFREAERALEAIAGVDITFGASVADNAKQVQAALAGLTPAQAVARLEKMGLSAENLKGSLEQLKPATENAGKSLKLLEKLSKDTGDGMVEVEEQSKEVRAVLEGLFGQKTTVSANELKDAIANLNREFVQGQKAVDIYEALLGKMGQIPNLLQEATDKAKGLDKFLGFASSIKDTDSLQQALDLVNDRLEEVRKNLDMSGISGSFFELQKRLANPETSESEAKAIDSYLKLMQSREGLEERIGAMATKSADDRIAAYELETERRKALGDLSLEQEEARLSRQLQMVQKNSSEEVDILEKLADIEEQKRKEREKDFSDAVKARLDAVKGGLAAAKPKNEGAEDEAEGYRKAIRELERWAEARKKAFAEAPEEAARYRDEVSRLKTALEEAEKKIPVERFEALAKELKDGVSKHAEYAVQLSQTAQAIAAVKAAIASKTVDQTKAEELLSSLEGQKLDLLRQQTLEKQKQIDELAALQLEAIQNEINLLELRKQAGENVEDELTAAHQKALDARLEMAERATQNELDLIEKKRQAALDAGVSEAEANAAAQESITHANEKAALKRQAVLDTEIQRQYQAEADGAKAKKSAGRSDDRGSTRGRAGEKATGGGSQPYQFSLGTFSNGSFIDGFGESWFDRRAKAAKVVPKAPNFERIRQGIQQQSNSGQTVNNNQSLVVNINGKGGKTMTASSPEDAVAKVRKAIADSGFFNGDSGGIV